MKIFYDLGTHLFEGLSEFNKFYNFDNTWKIYCFEANPYTYKIAQQKLESDEWLKSLDIEFINAAVSDQEGTTTIDCYYDADAQDYIDVGSNNFDLKDGYFTGIWPEMYEKMGEKYCSTVEVPTVCFSEFIDKRTKYYDEVVIKMDIEGSEFATLTKMLENNTHTLAKQMFIEWHERFWPEELEKYTNWKNNIMHKLVTDRVDAKIWW